MGALPARFRRSRVLVVGCGDIGLRVAALLKDKLTVRALSSQRVRAPTLPSQCRRSACYIRRRDGD
jgi:lactate dehydrogenase-like 2-hydroxyacid dehydrogenase